MTMTDPIADFLTRIRNANMAHNKQVEVPSSKIKRNMADILKREGFIQDVEYKDDNKQGQLKLYLKYGKNNERVISGLKRISKPGLRSYVNSSSIPKVLNGLGLAIISSSNGVITDKEARDKKVGGEVLAYIW